MLACAAAAETARLVREGESGSIAWMPDLGRESQPARVEAARRGAEYYGLEFVVGQPGLGEAGEHERVTRMLVDAAFEASRRGASGTLWPVCCQQDHTGEIDLARLGLAADRALLVQRLVSLGRRPVQVLTPYLDFTEREIADLALDLSLPVHLCWWWEAAASDPAAGAERERWTAALREIGWSVATAGAPRVVTGGTGETGTANEEMRRA